MLSSTEQVRVIRKDLERVEFGYPTVQMKPELGPATKRLSLSLRLWHEVFNTPHLIPLEDLSLAPLPSEQIFSLFEAVIDEIELYRGGTFVPNLSGHTARLDSILKTYLNQVAGHLQDRMYDDPKPEERPAIRSMIQWAEGLSARLATYEEMDELRNEAEEFREASVLLKKGIDDAQQRIGEARATAGAEAEAMLSVEFAKLAADELAIASRYRIATMWLIGVGVCVALGLHLFTILADQQQSPASAVYNLAVLGGIFGFSGYLGRQSGNHRQIAVWANTITVQLLEFDKFVAPVSDGMRDQIRLAFANRAFGSPPTTSSEEGNGASPLAIEQVLALINRSAGPK